MKSAEKRIDRRMALLAFLLTLAVLCSGLTNDSQWGDDFAGYLNQGIALGEGRLDAQIRLNVFMHPSRLPEEAGETLVYSMGYPLLLSGVYRLAGFDRTGFTSIVWYKLPSVLALAGLAAILYTFYRRRFPAWLSLTFGVLFCIHPEMRSLVDSLYSDAVFLFFAVLTLSMTEVFLSALSAGQHRRALWSGVVMGLAAGMTCATRLNGAVFCAGAGVMHLLYLRKKENRRGRWGLHAVPWIVFLILAAVFGGAVFPSATSNLSDFSRWSWGMLAKNAEDYLQGMAYWTARLVGIWPRRSMLFVVTGAMGAVLGLLAVLGAVKAGRREGVYLAILILTGAAVLILPYNQRLRYCYPVLPFMLLFAGYGGKALWKRMWSGRPAGERRARPVAALLVCLALTVITARSFSGDLLRLVRGEDVRESGCGTPFSAEAVDMYRFIRDNTPEESVIAFQKPRALYLATERRSFRLPVNGHSLAEADYYLYCRALDDREETEIIDGFKGTLRPMYSIGGFSLYAAEGRAGAESDNPDG